MVRKTYPDWKSIEETCLDLSQRFREFKPDLIIGITRGGLPMATIMSHQLECRDLVAVTARKSTAEGPNGLEVQDKSHVEHLPWIPEAAKRVLIVDDVVAMGDVFTAVRDAVAQRIGESTQIKFACLYGDRPRIEGGPYSKVLGSLEIGVEIDNVEEWIVFPWERE